ncbi:MAG TPA: hypothetical protein VFM12_08750 [Gemmatimonadales bacterium]|nr:hypothetical protein [Gemmatimonadales bacterium]
MLELHGQCACGAVAFRVATTSLGRRYCRCALCTTGAGEPVVTGLALPRHAVQWRGAMPLRYRRDGGDEELVCDCCGAHLATLWDEQTVCLEASCVDECSPIGVRCHVHALRAVTQSPALAVRC